MSEAAFADLFDQAVMRIIESGSDWRNVEAKR